MKLSKIVTGIILFCIVSFGLLYGIPKIIPTEMAEAYAGFATPTLAYGLAVVISGGYLVLSYRKAYSPSEIPQKKYEFYYATFDEEQKKILDAMTEEDKRRFVDEYEKVASEEKKRALNNNLFDWTHGFIPKGLKPVRTVVKLLVLASIAWTGFAAYEALEPSYEVYAKAMFETLPDGVYNYEGLPPIDLQAANGDKLALKRDVDTMAKRMLETQPKFLLEHCSIIHVYNAEKFQAKKPTDNTYAFASSADNSINLGFGGSSFAAGTITHELCHVFDFVHEISFTTLVNDLYRQYARNISDYATTNIHEFFAEAGKQYFHSPKQLQQNAPEVYNYLDQLFKPYMA